MKQCGMCGEWMPRSAFNKKAAAKDGYQPFCRTCMKTKQRDWYVENQITAKAKRAERRDRVRNEVREVIREAKDRPCTDCGVKYPYYVMQFDHLRDKEFTIASHGLNGKSVSDVVAEISKCEVVCANCHAVRTHNRRCSLV